MTEMLRQSLSAVIDDEADAFELRRVLDELGRDPELREVWVRYHLIGAALRGELPAIPGGDRSTELGDQVWQALVDAPGDPSGTDAAEVSAALARNAEAPSRNRWLGRTTALAVAASVAFAVVIGVDAVRAPSSAPAPAVAVERVAPSVVVPATASVENPTPQVRLASEVSASDVRRAHAYMLHHAQHQGLSQPSVMSLVKMATYEKP
jgi:sigma-E factor negative regulatory protein RseA